MEEKALKFAGIFLPVLTILILLLLPLFPGMHTKAVEAREARLAEQEFAAVQSQKDMEMENLEIRESTESTEAPRKGQLSLLLPEGVEGEEIEVENDYVTQTIRIDIPGTDLAYFDSQPISGSSSHIDTMSYSREGEDGIIEIVMDQIYELDTDYDSDYYYFDFLSPWDIYGKIVVVDAGHGGRVPGATKKGTMEKDIDLAIVQKLAEIAGEGSEDIGFYFTRLDDSNPTFDQRVQLANLLDANLFISVHNNSTDSGQMSGTNGTQAMYSQTSDESKRFAQICLEEVTDAIGSKKLELVEGDSIYIIRNSEVPVALIEVGFMSNQRELDLLCTDEYQQQTAQGIYNAVLRAFAEGF